ncbi:hypothetical protein FS837_008979 [Tulasnella sp. UAMH 9824]|nr:hypothetical protein FS837_008979 [Tulasnella sp. UAMH 9824]
MSSIKCPICFETHSPQLAFCTIKCGHIFCESCIQNLSQAARTNRQRLFCPKCRTPFREGPPDVITVFPEYESDEEDISTIHNRSLTGQDLQDVGQLAARADNVGIESDPAELEGVTTHAEQLLRRFRDGGGGNEETADPAMQLALLEQHLGRLRQRLNYHHRLESLKEEVTRLTAERDEHRDARDTEHAKYLEAKDHWRAIHRKYTERKERCNLLTQSIQERDTQIRDLQEAVRIANGKMMKQNMTINKANSELEETVARLKEKLEKCERDKLKLDKKYLAAKFSLQEIQRKHAKCKQLRPRPSSEIDDSLEIIPPPKPAPLRDSASSSSLRHSASNTSLQKSNSVSSLIRPALTERKRPFARVASLPSTSRDLENVEPPTDGDWEEVPSLLQREPSSSRSKPQVAPSLASTLLSKSKPRSKPPPFPFTAPRTNISTSKGKQRALPSSESEIQEITVDVPPVPASKRRKVSNDPWP